MKRLAPAVWAHNCAYLRLANCTRYRSLRIVVGTGGEGDGHPKCQVACCRPGEAGNVKYVYGLPCFTTQALHSAACAPLSTYGYKPPKYTCASIVLDLKLVTGEGNPGLWSAIA